MRGRIVAASAVSAALVAALIVVPSAASADDYPSWNDVVAAQQSEAATAAEVERIRGLLTQLAAEVQRTQEDLRVKGERWVELDALYRAKSSETATLRAQADTAATAAVESEKLASQWAATVVKVGGLDPTLELFTESDRADDILSAIGVSARISKQANEVYEQATQQRNTAQALTDQAAVMEQELSRLETEAEAAMQAAEAASLAATAALQEQQENRARLEQQLAVLTEKRIATEADYQVGVQVRAQEALRALGIDWAQVSTSGWVRPAGGWISSYYGWREEGWHDGVDLAQSCWRPIIAAASGTVSFTGWYGGYGYLTIINHGGGLETWYGHQPSGGIEVWPGQWVGVGQKIGNIGTTGNSTGCHLHFEVRVWGNTTDPVNFLAANGVYI